MKQDAEKMELHDLYGKHEPMPWQSDVSSMATIFGYGWGQCACGRTLTYCSNTGLWRPMGRNLCRAMIKYKPELSVLLPGCLGEEHKNG